jgi:hypothetical protein
MTRSLGGAGRLASKGLTRGPAWRPVALAAFALLGTGCVTTSGPGGGGGSTSSLAPPSTGSGSGGSGSTTTPNAFTTALSQVVQSVAQGAGQGSAPGAAASRSLNAGGAAANWQIMASLTAAGQPPMQTRPDAGLQQLFAKGTVSGQELITELMAMRNQLRQRKSAAAVGAFMGALDIVVSKGPGGTKTNAKEALVTAGLKAMEELLKQYVTSIAFAQLDAHLTLLTDDPQLLARESVTLPRMQRFESKQAQRVATMAAILVATRVTARMLKQAQQDFASIEGEYGQLIERREKSAEVLFSALQDGAGGGRDLAEVFNTTDLAYLRDGVAKMSIKEFSNDLGAQNLALRLLQKQDPQAFAEYKGRSDGLLGRTRGYLRTTGGVLAFGGLLATFAQEVMSALRGKDAEQILQIMPLAFEFVVESPPLVTFAFDAGSRGVELAVKRDKRFRVVSDGTAPQDFGRAREVFELLKGRAEAQSLFGEALFRNDNVGWLYRMYQCDKSETGRLLDTAVAAPEREKFARAYLAPDTVRFSFANAFESPGSSRERELGDDLLRRDHRERSDERTRAFGNLQRQVADGYRRWGDEQLMRLIFANRETAAVYASLQFGGTTIKPIPSAQSVFAYEALVDACSRMLRPAADTASERATDRPTDKPTARPAARPTTPRLPQVPQVPQPSPGQRSPAGKT